MPYGECGGCWGACTEFIGWPPPAGAGFSVSWAPGCLWFGWEVVETVLAVVVAVVVRVGGDVIWLSKLLEMVGEIGVIGLVGLLDEGSVLSSLVRFFLRNPRVGI